MFRLFLVLSLTACTDTGGSDSGDSLSDAGVGVDQVCTKVFECGGWGWEDQATCEDGWIDNDAYGTACADTDGYKSCMVDCMTLDCDDFAPCETDCWNGSC